MVRWWLCWTLAGCASAAADPPPACTPDTRYDTGSKRFGRYWKEDATGRTAAQIEKQFGAPGCKSPTLWRYWVPDGCSYQKTVVSLWFRGDKIVRVNAVDITTGEECL
jgi:hypothetical protein